MIEEQLWDCPYCYEIDLEDRYKEVLTQQKFRVVSLSPGFNSVKK